MNEAWKRFGRDNGASEQTQLGLSLNYLAVCQTSSGENSKEAAAALSGIQDVLNKKRASFSLEYPCHSPEQKRWFMMHVTPLQNSDRNVVVLHIDITERKLLEEALQERDLRLQVLSEASRAFAEASFETEAVLLTLNKIAERTAALIGDTCVITLFSENGQSLVPVAFYHHDPETLVLLRQFVFSETYDANKGIVGKVALTGQPLLIEEIDQDKIRSIIQKSSLPFLDKSGIYSLLIVPMLSNGKTIGTIGLSRDKPCKPYNQFDLVFLQDLADRAALAVQNTRLFEETQEKKNQLSVLHTSLDRSNKLMAALSHVAAQVQNNLDPSQVITTLGEELKKLHIAFFISLYDADRRILVNEYSSFGPARLSEAEKIIGMNYQGSILNIDKFPEFSGLIQDRKGLFVKDALSLGYSFLPVLKRTVIDAGFRVLGFSKNAKAIVLPLIGDQQTIGIMTVWGEDLDELDVPAFTVFSGQVAAAMENARLYKETRLRAEQLSALTARLSEVEEQERRMLAQELHDQVGQILSALGFNLNVIRNSLVPENGDRAIKVVEDSLTLVSETVRRTRDIMAELHSPVLDDYGLLAALRWNAEQFVLHSEMEITVDGDPSIPRLPANIESALYKITQEILLNATKHAQAHEVSVYLSADEDRFRLLIEDNGIGFDPEMFYSSDQKPSWGLLSIQERTKAIGGKVMIDAAPGRGTKITVEVPL